MSKFNALRMAQEVAKYPQIAIRDSFFGLFSETVYKPTESKVESYSNYYDADNGLVFRRLIECPDEHLSEMLQSLHETHQDKQGRFRLDLCISEDCRFIAMQLNEVSAESVHHLTPIRYFEGKEAEQVEDLIG